MSYTIRITDAAQRDINDAANYIDSILKNNKAAVDLLYLTNEKISYLSNNPHICAIVDNPVLKAWKIRFIVIKNYLAFYSIDEEAQIVYIVRFLYGKRELSTILKQSLSLK